VKTILVTGGAGFIGSTLSERLVLEGNRVVVIDNFNSFYDPSIKHSNIAAVREAMKNNNISCENFILCTGDIRDEAFLAKVFSENKIDSIVHLAAMAGVRPSIEDPKLYYDVNIVGTLNILEECRKNNIKEVAFVSSSSVYGNNEKVPFAETDPVDNPISPYASTKKSGELLCYTYHHLFDISFACLRFFTVYGPRQRPDLAINKFTKLILEDKEIPFFGDGSTSRDYTYIDDIVDGIIKATEWLSAGEEKKYDIFNLGGDKTVSLKRMVEVIEETLGKKARINQLPMQPGDVNRTCADISHSKEVLGYSPKTTFEEGISKFVKWFKK